MPTGLPEAKGYSYKYKDPKPSVRSLACSLDRWRRTYRRPLQVARYRRCLTGMLGVDPRKTVMPLMAAAGTAGAELIPWKHV